MRPVSLDILTSVNLVVFNSMQSVGKLLGSEINIIHAVTDRVVRCRV